MRAELGLLRSRMQDWTFKAREGFAEKFVRDTIDGVLIDLRLKGVNRRPGQG